MNGLLPIAKAIVAFIVPLIVTAVAKWGFDVDADALTSILMSVATALIVWATPNRTPAD